MSKHRNPRQRLAKRETPDNRSRLALPAPPEPQPDDESDHLVCVLRDQLRRADAFVTSAEKELLVSWGVGDDGGDDEDDSVQRLRMRVEYLVEAGKLAVREAQYTGEQIAAELAKRGGAA
ncbi:MAG TPA: hypothetical protein VFU97_15820 [Xanthobacteraceae bacterium]|nr:hypothetical protein [Xanthobacteraceae bacterium]